MSTQSTRLLVKNHLHYGYFQRDARHVYVTCPRCRDEVITEVLPWATTKQRTQALRDALLDHLTYDHEDGSNA